MFWQILKWGLAFNIVGLAYCIVSIIAIDKIGKIMYDDWDMKE